MKISPFIICVFAVFSINAQSFDWAMSFGSVDYETVSSVTTDASGNVYTTGFFNGTVDFDPGFSIYNLASQGLGDIFVQKLDASGNFIWAVSVGGIDYDKGCCIKVDISGNIYLLGIFKSTVDFNPGPGTNNITSASAGSNDVFLLKLDSNGNFIWVKRTGGSLDDDGYSLNLDASGNCYTTGVFRGTVDFNPEIGINNLTSAGNGDVFVQKLDINGNYLWAKQMGGTMNDESYSSCIDSDGNIYTTGYFQGTADFDPNIGTNYLVTNGITDIFVQKMDPNGNLLWVKKIGGASFDYSFSIDSDLNGNVYTVGYFLGTCDFDPSALAYNLISAGGADIFLQKMDSSGNFVWVKQIGGSGHDYVNSMNIDQYGNIHAIGSFESTVDFDPGVGTNLLSSSGASDIYILKMNSAGQFLRVKRIGGSATDQASCIFVDNSFNIVIAGKFQGIVDLDPTSGINSSTSNGNEDGFVEKLSQCYAAPGVDQITACDSITWIDGVTFYNSSNNVTLTINATSECDSVVTLNLTINNSSIGTEVLTVCDSYYWIDGNTYTSSTNTPTWILTNAAGCDSTVTLNLTILNSSNSIDIQTACDSLTWMDGITYYSSTNNPFFGLTNSQGCDSIITLNLTILNSTSYEENITSCGSYTWSLNNQTYLSSGQYTDTILNTAGCDSIVTLDLTILPLILPAIINTFSLPSAANTCIGKLATTVSGNADFELTIDNGSQTVTSSGYSLVTGLCAGVHDLRILDNCGDSLITQFVIPIDSNYVFNNPFIDSLAQDSLGVTLTNCDIYYNSIDTAYIDSIWAIGNTVNVIWNIVDSNGSNFDTTSYVLNNGTGVYWLQLSVFCPTKSFGDYFAVTEAIYFGDGYVSTAGLSDKEMEEISVFPNPTSNAVTIKFESPSAKLNVLDAQGKLTQQHNITSGSAIDLSKVETGVYFFELTTEKGKVVKRVVKN